MRLFSLSHGIREVQKHLCGSPETPGVALEYPRIRNHISNLKVDIFIALIRVTAFTGGKACSQVA